MNTPEEEYIAKITPSHRKKYAQFFTPEPIARFMCEWVLGTTKNCKVLEPAYGLGIFSRILSSKAISQIDAFELDPVILKYAKPHIPQCVNLSNSDYLDSSWGTSYDAIICNPPYLKFHDYDNTSSIAEINRRLNLRLNGFTNLYTLFLLKSIAQLKPGGRLAYIIPSEFMNADYGVEVKRALLKSGALRHIIVVRYTECAFSDALTTACIVLCENTHSDTMRFSSISQIEQLDTCLNTYVEYKATELKAERKWKSYYESRNALGYSNLVPFSRFARVSRGIATGANSYFALSRSRADEYHLPNQSLVPCVCRSADVPQTIFTIENFEKLANSGKASYLFDGSAGTSNPYVKNYINLGENASINNRYLTSGRTPWYAIENRPPSPIWVSVFNRTGLRFIRNEANVRNLTCFHCVYPNDMVDADVLFAYLITDVAKEIFQDNSREYGNGLIKYEPNDLNKGLVADLSKLSVEDIEYVKEIYDIFRSATNQDVYREELTAFFRQKFSV